MSSLLPHRFLFRYSITVGYEAKLPWSGKKLLSLSEGKRIPGFAALDGAASFGDLRLAWNERGLAVSVEVTGKRRPPRCDPQTPDLSDGLQVWIDTRNTQSIHRASRFCHHFCLLPRGGGRDQSEPLGVQLPIARAREPSPLADSKEIRLSAAVGKSGYLLEAWLPARALHGYDPDSQARLGFYYNLRDSELGEQTFSVGEEFPFAYDPSLWGTLELVK
jgi:hypothetical protein